MAQVTIYGSSDDLIEVEGDFGDEYLAYDCWKYLHFDDGTVIKGGYALVPGKGWQFEVVKPGTAIVAELEPVFDDGDHYTDRLQLTGDITCVACFESQDGPTESEILQFFDDLDPRDYDLEKLTAAHRQLTA